MQPIHATSDMLSADRYWGDRARLAYAWRTQLDAGATLAFGSDAPVDAPHRPVRQVFQPDPFHVLIAAIFHQFAPEDMHRDPEMCIGMPYDGQGFLPPDLEAVFPFQGGSQSPGRIAVHLRVREFPHTAQQTLRWSFGQKNPSCLRNHTCCHQYLLWLLPGLSTGRSAWLRFSNAPQKSASGQIEQRGLTGRQMVALIHHGLVVISAFQSGDVPQPGSSRYVTGR
jgi:hypothetical protein